MRVHEVGCANRPPTPAELDRMKALVRQAMEEGAVGLSSALIYAPACYAQTDELIELCKVAAPYRGLYISHLRSEGAQLLEAADEFLRAARQAGIPAEIYHLKALGQSNWGKLEAARVLCRHRDLRSGEDPGPCHVRPAPSIRHRGAGGLG